MKKINFTQDVLPHLIAVGIFLIVTVIFFNPVFFDNKTIIQADIQQWEGSSKALRDFRDQTGEEGLWAPSMFSGMPAYLINVHWSNQPVNFLKSVLSLGIPHPVANIFLSFICFYILLLTFKVRPYLAIVGALAFGLSSYMIIGLSAGHNGRIGAIAFMPLVMAGVHLAFTNRKILGFVITMAGMALEFRENHLQITYYLLIIILVYGIVTLIQAIKEKTLGDFLKTTLLLIPAVLIAVGTFIGQLWGVSEYGKYTIRGNSELIPEGVPQSNGLPKSYAFDASNGILEPFMMLIPNFYGGNARHYFVQDPNSNSYKALMSSSDNQLANQLARYSVAYWGPQSYTIAYYAGAIMIFLCGLGIAFADRKYTIWLLITALLGILISYGSNFSSFNYFLFDYIPGVNKFRSVTFALIITLFSIPLLGLIGLEKFISQDFTPQHKKKLLIVFAATGGLCLVFWLFAGMFSFLREGDHQLPTWFSNALIDDRKSIFRSDAFRSFVFIALTFGLLYLQTWKKIPTLFYVAIILLPLIDLGLVDARYFGKDNFQRKRDKNAFQMTEADQLILQDKSYYRVYNIQPGAFTSEANTSYYHNSLGGYHGAKIRRYQDLYDSCLFQETNQFIRDAQAGQIDFSRYNTMKMLNAKYLVFGASAQNVIENPEANGPAWFVSTLKTVTSPIEELEALRHIDTRTTAIIDTKKFTSPTVTVDSAASIQLIEHTPKYLKYESSTTTDGLAVFSEIYYPEGWQAFIDGEAHEILRANYVLRALSIPAGNHTIEFKFMPKAYAVGNTITKASSWILLLLLLGGIGWNLKEEKH
jgi:hypothetical protein